MEDRIKHVVIVGGGTAGWITAGILAARHPDRSENGLRITLIESPDVPTIGVGEGTWPTIRKTLARIGLREAEFLTTCDASFKQGSRFDRWVRDEAGDSYHHPFELPVSQDGGDALHIWQSHAPQRAFSEAVCVQAAPGLDGLAPRQRTMPDYVGAMNYAYHLDAGKFSELLKAHVVNRLGVHHLPDHVTAINGDERNITSVTCRQAGEVRGDLFVDCTGKTSMLLGGHFSVPFIDQGHILFNDSAVVTQVPVTPDSAIVSETVSTAHEAGWIWDIGLTTRRGVGCVYASDYIDEGRAEEILRNYISTEQELTVRKIEFRSGHRAHFWHGNCVAVGLSAGFLEPLEASAIVLIELSAEMIAENLPVSRQTMPVEARKFNALFNYRWGRIIDFLKLHYVLSQRTEKYRQDNRNPDTIPERLQENLEVWKTRPPSGHDFEQASEIFPVSSYLFVAYGMGMAPTRHPTLKPRVQDALYQQMKNVFRKQKAFADGLPTNRALLSALARET